MIPFKTIISWGRKRNLSTGTAYQEEQAFHMQRLSDKSGQKSKRANMSKHKNLCQSFAVPFLFFFCLSIAIHWGSCNVLSIDLTPARLYFVSLSFMKKLIMFQDDQIDEDCRTRFLITFIFWFLFAFELLQLLPLLKMLFNLKTNTNII